MLKTIRFQIVGTTRILVLWLGLQGPLDQGQQQEKEGERIIFLFSFTLLVSKDPQIIKKYALINEELQALFSYFLPLDECITF